MDSSVAGSTIPASDVAVGSATGECEFASRANRMRAGQKRVRNAGARSPYGVARCRAGAPADRAIDPGLDSWKLMPQTRLWAGAGKETWCSR